MLPPSFVPPFPHCNVAYMALTRLTVSFFVYVFARVGNIEVGERGDKAQSNLRLVTRLTVNIQIRILLGSVEEEEWGDNAQRKNNQVCGS